MPRYQLNNTTIKALVTDLEGTTSSLSFVKDILFPYARQHMAAFIKTEKDKKQITKKLSELNGAEKYIIVFWNSGCSHCLDEIPQLQKFIKSYKKTKLKVIAVGLEDDNKAWKEKIKSFPEFTNVLGLGKWDNEIGNKYDVKETPTYFVLDKAKHIIAKPDDFEALKAFIIY